MAGLTCKTLFASLSNITLCPRIIRAHPNTPAMVGCGCAVYSLGQGEKHYLPLGRNERTRYLSQYFSGATEADGEIVRQLFSSVGLAEQVPESQQVRTFMRKCNGNEVFNTCMYLSYTELGWLHRDGWFRTSLHLHSDWGTLRWRGAHGSAETFSDKICRTNDIWRCQDGTGIR